MINYHYNDTIFIFWYKKKYLNRSEKLINHNSSFPSQCFNKQKKSQIQLTTLMICSSHLLSSRKIYDPNKIPLGAIVILTVMHQYSWPVPDSMRKCPWSWRVSSPCHQLCGPVSVNCLMVMDEQINGILFSSRWRLTEHEMDHSRSWCYTADATETVEIINSRMLYCHSGWRAE